VSFLWGFLLLCSVLCIRRLAAWLLELIFLHLIVLIIFGEAHHLRSFQKRNYLQPSPTLIPSTFRFPMPVTKFFAYKSETRFHIGETVVFRRIGTAFVIKRLLTSSCLSICPSVCPPGLS